MGGWSALRRRQERRNVQRKIPTQPRCENQSYPLGQCGGWKEYTGALLLTQNHLWLTYVQRIKREVELWSKIHDTDQGKHIIPFCGFYSPDGMRLWAPFFISRVSHAPIHFSALVSPWISNGDALTYVKRHDNLLNYRKLVRCCDRFSRRVLISSFQILGIAEGIRVLQSMDPPVIHGNLRAVRICYYNHIQERWYLQRKRYLSATTASPWSRTLRLPRYIMPFTAMRITWIIPL